MKIEPGKRYRFLPVDGSVPVDGELHDGYGGGYPIFAPDGLDWRFLIDPDGVCEGHGRLVDIEGATRLPPVFRHDDAEHRRLQQFFRDERDVTLGTGR